MAWLRSVGLRGEDRQDRCLRSGFNSGSGGWAQAQVLGSLGSSTPHDLGWVLQIDPWHTPRQPAPTCFWGGGSRWGPLITNQASRRSWPRPGRDDNHPALLSGKSPHCTALPGNGDRKNLGDLGGRGVHQAWGLWKTLRLLSN